MAKAQKTVTKKSNASIYDKLSAYLNNKRTFYIILFSGIVLALISFNARVTEANDDSLYIEAGYKYVHEFPNYYYTANAPMYPMFLGLLTLIFGTNLVVFKLFSVILFITGAILYYKALDKKVPEILKYFVFTFICINHLMLYFSSQTFSEPFYMLVQASFFYFFCKYHFSDDPIGTDIKKDLKRWLVLGLLMMLLTLAKNVLIFGIAAIAVFYFFRKEYKKMVVAMASFGLFKFLYELIKGWIWGDSAIQYKSQMSILLNKDPYDATQGQEDLAGFFGRFTDNIGLYLGKRVYQILGFMDEKYAGREFVEKNGEMVPEMDNKIIFLSLIVLFLTFFGLYKAIKNKQMVIIFLTLFAGTVCFGTFFVLQARWDQPRFVLVHMPAILLASSYGLYEFFKKSNFNQRIFIAFLAFILSSMLISSFSRGIKNIPIVTKNLKGDIYYGYTPIGKIIRR